LDSRYEAWIENEKKANDVDRDIQYDNWLNQKIEMLLKDMNQDSSKKYYLLFPFFVQTFLFCFCLFSDLVLEKYWRKSRFFLHARNVHQRDPKLKEVMMIGSNNTSIIY
jgi:hypothetical protein